MRSRYDILGTRVDSVDLVALFGTVEGDIRLYYGRIGHGKTYSATADCLSFLMRGNVCWVNWDVKWSGFDERSSFAHVFFKTVFFKSDFYVFPSSNLKRYVIDDRWAQGYELDLNGLPFPSRCSPKPDGTFWPDFISWFDYQTDCYIFADEGHVLLDSYKTITMDMRHRTAVLHTRHKNRTICIITQRPTAIHVSARANVNRFYKCEKKMSWPFLVFKRTEFDELKSETVDELSKPVSTRVYFASKKVLDAYDTHYIRAGVPISNVVHFDAYHLTFSERLLAIVGIVKPSFMYYPEKAAEGSVAVRPRGYKPLGDTLPLTPRGKGVK